MGGANAGSSKKECGPLGPILPQGWGRTSSRGLCLLRAAVIALLLIFVITPLFADESPRSTMDLRIAVRYRDHARKALARGNTDEAERILRAGMDWASSLSDIPALLARLEDRAGRSRIGVLALQDRALRTAVFLEYPEEELEDERARVLFAMGRYREALEALEQLPLTHERLVLRLSARLHLQPLAENLALCRDALEQFPDSLPLSLLVLDACARVPFDPSIHALVERVLVRIDFFAQEDPGVLWRAALFTRDFVRRRELSSRSIREGCRESGAILGALDTGALGAPDAISLFFGAGRAPILLDDVDRLWRLLRSDEERVLFRAKLAAFSGTLSSSTAWGPAAPLYLHIEAGQLKTLSIDRDADRLVDVELTYADNLPALARVSPAPGYGALSPLEDSPTPSAMPAIIQWDHHPALLSTEIDGILARYPLRSVSWALFPHAERPWCSGLWSLPDASSSYVLPTPAFVRAHASEAFREGWGIAGSRERVILAAGKPLASTEERAGRVVVKRRFVNGFLDSEDLDLDGDGRFELRRLYALPGKAPAKEADPGRTDPLYGTLPVLLAVQADLEGTGLWVEVDSP